MMTEKVSNGQVSINNTSVFVNHGFDNDLEAGSKTYLAVPISSKVTQPVAYSWENLEVFVQVDQGNCFSRMKNKTPTIQKKILDNVSGVVQPGEFLAIMGASGAGKTTLLNCLTFRNRTSRMKIHGERFINGASVNTDSLARISGYVQQDDLFIPTFTVQEHLRFQALLRMDKHLSYKERMNRVEEVINELGLKKCASTEIGNPERGIKGISGGERKRLALASEVLTNPSLMFCDEPTSGLDSFMAQNIVKVLKNLAESGKTVICTIHQPSSEVFDMFDRILLMAEGRTAFLGPIRQTLSFFASQGLPCPQNYNPADFYIHTLAVVPGEEIGTRKRSKAICDSYDSSQLCQQVMEQVKLNRPNENFTKNSGNEGEIAMKKSPYKANWFAQFRAVLWRSILSVIRDSNVLRVKLIQTVLIASIIAFIYQGQTLGLESSRNIQGVLFLFLTNMSFQNAFSVISVVTSELPIFLREHFNGMYRTDVYFLAKSLADVPLFIILPFLFASIDYWAIGLNTDVDRYFICSGIIILIAFVAGSYGFMISCLANSTNVALALSAPLIIPLMLFGGFFLEAGTAPAYLDWIRYISWFNYGNEALTINQWKGTVFNDTSDPPNSILCPGGLCSGELIIKDFNFDTANFELDIGLLAALVVGFRIIAFLALLSKTYKKN